MGTLSFKNINKVYPNGFHAVKDFNLEVADKEFIIFVGPSGCGKTTTLRMVAGLEEISSGELSIDARVINDVEPKDRDIAMVFQNFALYPHMTVYDNMAFGLKLRKMPKAQIDQRVKEAARILGLEMYLSRKPKALSGGQRQRVALGRAIVREPKVFLLHEPLSNLDAKLRSQMRTEITKLHNRLATTFIYVTHDQVEAMTMGTRIVVMKDGFMQQVDTPLNLYDHPINQFVAGFIGTPQMNFFTGKLTGTRDNVSFEFGLNKVTLSKEKVDLIVNLEKYLNTDKEVVFGVRPEDIHEEQEWVEEKKMPTIEIDVDVVEALGPETLIYCSTAKEKVQSEDGIVSLDDETSDLIAKIDSRSKTKRGDKIMVALDIAHCHIFDKETEITIVARDEENKAQIEELQARRAEEEAEKAAAAAAKLAEEEAKAAAIAEKKRLKLEKKLAKQNAKNVGEEKTEEQIEE